LSLSDHPFQVNLNGVSVGMTLQKCFGRVLSERRKDASISQQKLAEIAGLDRTYISLLERGERQPTLETLVALANALEEAPEALLKRVMEAFNAR